MPINAPEDSTGSGPGRAHWISRALLGIVLATFLSDFSHEMCTAVLPMYLASIGLGAASLGLIEGLADFLASISKLLGGVVGHHVERKRPLTALGYLVTALGTSGIGLVRGVGAILSLRGIAWCGRGFRSPLRDYLLADAVEPTHYGRAYGLERAGDMLGAVAGPLVAVLLIWLGLDFRTLILWAIIPGVGAAAAMYFLTTEKSPRVVPKVNATVAQAKPAFPRAFWLYVIGVGLFGMGDFSRTFLILLVANALGVPSAGHVALALSAPVLLYALHNLTSAAAAYPIGHAGDRRAKLPLLAAGYALGVVTNGLLAIGSGSIAWLVPIIFLSAIYIAAEETLEKAAAAELLPRELRSLGFGTLACVNAVGDMLSSFYVGWLLHIGRPELAFGTAAGLGGLGVLWMLGLMRWRSRNVDRISD